MSTRVFDKSLLAAAVAVALVALALAAGNVVAGQHGLQRHLIDAYFYFEAADSVRQTGAPDIGWPQGPDDKYFPGYGVVLGWWSMLVGDDPWVAWRSLQVVLLMAIAPAAMVLMARLGFVPWVAVLGGALVATNPVLQRWAGVPFSEPLTLLLLILQGIVALTPQWRGRAVAASWAGAVALGVLGGAASATRIEALALQAPLFAAAWWVGGLRSPVRLGVAAALVGGPLGAWWMAYSGGQAPHYVDVGRTSFVPSLYFNKFWNTFANTIRIFQIQSGQMWLHLGYWATWHTALVATFLALRGVLGGAPRAWASVVMGYCLLHGLWYYESERYAIVVLPLVYATLLAGLHWLFEQTPHTTVLAGRGNTVAMAALLAAQTIVHGGSAYVLDDHVRAINPGRPDEEYQLIAAALPADAVAITDLVPELGLWHTGTTWFVTPVVPDNFGHVGLEAGGRAAYERVLPVDAPARLVLQHELDDYPALAALARQRGATMESQPFDDIRIWLVPPAQDGSVLAMLRCASDSGLGHVLEDTPLRPSPRAPRLTKNVSRPVQIPGTESSWPPAKGAPTTH